LQDGTFGTERGSEISMRRNCVRTTEEYARHNGHAGLPREPVDGTTGF